MTDEKLTSAEVVYALVEAKAAGKLSVTEERGRVIVRGSQADRDRAQLILTRHRLTVVRKPQWDEWCRL